MIAFVLLLKSEIWRINLTSLVIVDLVLINLE